MNCDTSEVALTSPERRSRSIFVGENGIRAGWSALIFLAIFVVLVFISALPFFSFIHFQVKRGDPQPAYVAMVQEGVSAALVLLATWIMSRIEKRPVRVYGMRERRSFRGLSGAVSGDL